MLSEPEQLIRHRDYVTGWRIKESGFDYRRKKEYIFRSVQTDTGAHTAPSTRDRVDLSSWTKRPGSELYLD
jgi:hypothetical protein